MITFRSSKERGHEEKGWLESYHSFSFNTYYDAAWSGFHNLRVLNEEKLQGGKGFPDHYHKDIEILTYVIDGALEHKDSLGKISVIRPGEMHHLSAGHGVTHTIYNLSHHLPAHFIEIWINPKVHGIPPSENQNIFSSAAKWGRWCLVVSGNGRDGSIMIHQDADIYLTLLEGGEEIAFEALSDRYYWLHVVSGVFNIHGREMSKGDAAAFFEESTIKASCIESGELMLFDLAEI